MNHHPLAGTRDSPLAEAMLRFAVISMVTLLLVICLFLAGRRWEGAFDRPLNWSTMLALGIASMALVSGLRVAWPRTPRDQTGVSSWARLVLPTVAIVLFCYALSLPGSASWAVALLWFLVVSEEGTWWLADRLPRNGRQPAVVPRQSSASVPSTAPPLAELPAAADQSAADQSVADQSVADQSVADQSFQVEFGMDADDEAAGDITQQMTRIRDADGADLVFGQACAEFTEGERSQSIHLAFCPPLVGTPRITVMHAGGPAAAISVAQAETFGARFDVRLGATAGQPERVMVEFEARGAMPPADDA